MTFLDLAQSLQGKLRDGNSQNQYGVSKAGTAIQYGVAVGDSADGWVTIRMDNAATDGSADFSVPCDSSIKSGDRVTYITNRGYGTVKSLANVTKIAEEADATASATNQYFWHDTNGIHVSNVAEDPAGTRNILINSLGILLRKAAITLVSISESAVAFFDGSGNQTASFGSSGATIGITGRIQAIITSAYMTIGDSIAYSRFYSHILQMWHRKSSVDPTMVEYLHIGPDNQSDDEDYDPPYFVFGKHVGQNGDYSIAMGQDADAAYDYSVAIGQGVETTHNNEVAVGRYNDTSNESLIFSVGDGTADNARHNMLELDSSGTLTVFNEYYDHNGLVCGIPSGGTTGQVLAKSNNSNYMVSWVSHGAEVLFSGTGVSDVSLSKSITNFNRARVYFDTDQGSILGYGYEASGSVTVEDPDGKYVVLSVPFISSQNSCFFMFAKTMHFDGANLYWDDDAWSDLADPLAIQNDSVITVTKVEAWNE